MNTRQIDEALTLWRDRLGAAAQNLVELQAHPVYKPISASNPALSGETAAKGALAVRTLSWLLQYFDLLQGAIAKAEDLRRNMPVLFGAEDREREISAILQGPSIQLPSVQVPFGQRSLLGGVENASRIAPPDLLRVMESAFEQTKQIVIDLDYAWESVGRSLDDCAHKLAILQGNREYLDNHDRGALDGASARFRQLQESASNDPLRSRSEITGAFEELLNRLLSQLEKNRRERVQVQTELAASQRLLAELRQVSETASLQCAEACRKTDFVLNGNSSAEKLAGLSDWLERLRNAQSTPASLLLGFRNWTEAARQLLEAENALLRQAQQKLAMRSELRGRFDALKAKARAYDLAEHVELLAAAEQAKSLLYQRPTPLALAAERVANYETKLNSLAAGLVCKEERRSC